MRIAKYMRLSNVDLNESNSIVNQSAYLDEYITRNFDDSITVEFIDNGYTGMNFERPGFMDMLDKVRKQEIEVILVKDVSRLGRNYIEVGDYIEHVFPFLGVRFVSVNDNFDSERVGDNGLNIAFSNLINNFYVQDLSKKIKSAFRTRVKNRTYKIPLLPFGYVYDEDHKIQIHEQQAETIRLVFKLFGEIRSMVKVARKLNDLGILAPRGQMQLYDGQPVTIRKWKPDYVSRLMSNRRYTGVGIFFTRKNDYVGGKRNKLNDRDKWVYIPDTFPVIIDEEYFNKIQSLRREGRNQKRLLSNKTK